MTTNTMTSSSSDRPATATADPYRYEGQDDYRGPARPQTAAAAAAAAAADADFRDRESARITDAAAAADYLSRWPALRPIESSNSWGDDIYGRVGSRPESDPRSWVLVGSVRRSRPGRTIQEIIDAGFVPSGTPQTHAESLIARG